MISAPHSNRFATRTTMLLGSLLTLTAGACHEPDDGGNGELRQPVSSLIDAATCGPSTDAGSEHDAGRDAGGTLADPSQPSGLKIVRVSASGAGCSTSQGNAKIELNRDGTNFVATLEGFKVGPGARVGTSSCTLILDVDAPAGRVHALEWVHASGSATLGAGDSAVFDGLGAFTGSSSGESTSQRVDGPHTGALTFDLKPAAPRFSQCGRLQQVQLRAFLTGKFTGTASSIRIDKLGPVKFAVEPCNG